MDYLYWLLICAAYLTLLVGLARVVPARTYPLLRWLQWGGVGLGLVFPLGLWALTSGDWTLRSTNLACLLLLVSGLAAGIRARRHLSAVPFLSYFLAGVIVLASPALLAGMVDESETYSSDTVYQDHAVTIMVKRYFSLSRYPDPRVYDTNLYQTRWLLFDEYVGQLELDHDKEWWKQVSHLTFHPDSNLVRLRWWKQPYTLALHRPLVEPAYQPVQPAMPEPASPPAPPPVNPNIAYTYVEVMPQLPAKAGMAYIDYAIQQRLVVPRQAAEGRIFVKLTVTKTGDMQNISIVKGLNAPADSAVLAAVCRLPRFVPGRQNGKVVNVRLTLPITLRKPKPPRKPRTPRR